jgi:hypothetical protein
VGSEADIRTVFNYAKKAHDSMPSDAKLTEFYNEVKTKFEQYRASQQQPAETPEETKRSGSEERP